MAEIIAFRVASGEQSCNTLSRDVYTSELLLEDSFSDKSPIQQEPARNATDWYRACLDDQSETLRALSVGAYSINTNIATTERVSR